MSRVVFICTGNICRSPMAEGLLRTRLHAIGRDDILVSSMGIHGLDAQPATAAAIALCREKGIDIESHRSRPLAGNELVEADLVLTMEPLQKDFVKLFFPQISERVHLLGSWPDEGTKKDAIADPMGKSNKVYAKIYGQIAENIERILPDVNEMLPR